ncbi:ABC transporter permease [Nonomuraea cavernae]|uniref:ABC transporter permease n=1 Tax=Nonomuraea cavernae TaxID=2045107 RepID=A0A918DK72_9ACTN|nr:ABC transporter permease [Nonomuraea cavernae]MCA2186635.1 ABC transporter permease [Nonomuraea cavernae]GGO71681.1 ABC transporter permease [Nonomuraea cavernae]
MSTAETRTRTTPGLVPVPETSRATERRPPEPPAGAVPPRRSSSAFWRLLGSELGLTFRRPRNLVMLGVLAGVPVVMGVALRLVAADAELGGIVTSVAGNSLMLTFASLSFLVVLLMPVAVAMVAGDAIAGEAGTGTLRYLLAAPAGRTRLLAVKYLNAVVFSFAVTAVVALSALVTGLIMFPVGPVTLLSGTTVPVAEGLLRILISVGYVGAGMAALAAVALALSTFTEVSIGAVAGTMVIVIVSQVLRAIPQFDGLADYLLPARWTGFDGALRSPIDTGAMAEGLLTFGAYIVLSGSVAWARFSGKDITS